MSENETSEKIIGRNEPCPCGSGKKYKRCHGVAAAPKLTPPRNATPSEGGGPMGGFDPSQMDPELMGQFSRALQKLPKGQMQRLQSIMQRAMSGKDVTREAAELERLLPLELQNMMRAASMGAAGGAPTGLGAQNIQDTQDTEMTEEQARALVAQAAAEGKISKDKAESLLASKKENR